MELKQIVVIYCCLHATLSARFPIADLFNVSEPGWYPGRLQQFLCNGYGQKCCDCHSGCMRYKTCCIDKLWNESNPIPIQTYLHMFINESKKYKDLTCETLLSLNKYSLHSSERLLMVSTCLPTAHKDDVANCTNRSGISVLPVFGTDKYLYKNSFCAQCNFVEQFETVNITAKCKRRKISGTSSNINFLSQFDDCSFKILRNNIVRYPYVSSCPTPWSILNRNCPKSSKFYEYCKAYTGKMSEYANYHCFRCNQYSTSNPYLPIRRCGKSGRGRPIGGIPTAIPIFPGVFSWSFTINFSLNTRIQIQKVGAGKTKYMKGLTCPDWEMFNLQKGICSKYYCPPSYIDEGSKCVKRKQFRSVIVNLENSTFDGCLLSRQAVVYVILLHEAINLSNFTTTFQLEMDTANESFTKISETYRTLFKRSIPVNMNLLNKLQNKLSFSSSPIWLYAKYVFVSSLKKQILSHLYGFDISRTFPSDRLCARPISYDGNSRIFSSNCSTSVNNVTVQTSEFISWIEFKKRSANKNLSICLQYHLQSDCRLQLISSNYTIDSNKTLTYYGINNNSFRMTAEHHFPLENGTGVCLIEGNGTNEIIVLRWLKTLAYIEYNISITGTSVSIICYISIIMTYMLFKKLRNIPGLNTLTLCCCLLTADVSFIIATQSHTVYQLCKVIGIMLHWSLLAAHMWMLVVTFDITSRIAVLTVVTRERNMGKFLKYCMFAFSVPTIIVLLTTIFNETSVIFIGYGKNGICWIKHFDTRIVSYIVPVAFTFIISGIALSYTIFKVKLEDNRNQKALNNSGSNVISISKISLKLVIILGLTESLGFIQIRRSSGVLTHTKIIFNSTFLMLYTILRSFRGFMLWFIYICNSRVYSMYKQLIQEQKMKESPSNTTETMQLTSTDINSSSKRQ